MNFELEAAILDDDVVDAVTATAKKDSILERLNKRNKDRQNQLDVRIEQRNKESLGIEGLDYFAQSFTERARDIEIRIENISEAAIKNGGDASNIDLTRLFAEITVEIQELQRYLTTSIMFLTEFKIKTCQNIVNELTNRCEETRVKLIPKKKFGFSGKKTVPKAIAKPKLSAADCLDTAAKTGLIAGNALFTWTLANRQGEYICLKDDAVNGKDVTISNLRNCFVELQGHTGSLQISNAMGCTFLCGPISRSLFAEELENCTLAVACQQLRLHSSSMCRIYLHVTCRAIIEDCKKIDVASYNYEYPTIEADFQAAGLSMSQNNYTDVADFNWLSPDVPSPNWQLLKDSAQPNWNMLRQSFGEKHGDNIDL